MNQIFVWTFGDVVGLLIAAVFFLAWLVVLLWQWMQQRWCKHGGGISETAGCDAICRKCGKNLGFIGAWRGKRSGAL